MGTELTTFTDRPALSVKYTDFFRENKNIQDRETVPTLSIEGKNFHVVLHGERTTLTKNDADGDPVPVTTLKVVVLDQNPVRGRAYYGKTYDPAKAAMPDCWSDDCITPSPQVKAESKQAANCAACPMSVKGSRKTDQGKESTACQQHQFIAIMVAKGLEAESLREPLRVKLPITSIWDGQNKANDEAGWFAFKNYTDFLRAHGVDHTALLVTKMKFDSSAAYPKLLFARDKFLTDEQLDILVPIIQSQKVKDLISASWTPNGRDGVRQGAISGPADDEAASVAKDVTPERDVVAEQEAALATQHAKAVAEAEAKAAKKVAKQAAAEEAAKIAKAAADAAAKAAADEDDDGEVNLPGTAAAVIAGPKAAQPKVIKAAQEKIAVAKVAKGPSDSEVPAGLDGLLSAWGDDE